MFIDILLQVTSYKSVGDSQLAVFLCMTFAKLLLRQIYKCLRFINVHVDFSVETCLHFNLLEQNSFQPQISMHLDCLDCLHIYSFIKDSFIDLSTYCICKTNDQRLVICFFFLHIRNWDYAHTDSEYTFADSCRYLQIK